MALEEAKREQEHKTSIQKRLAALASSKVGLLISQPICLQAPEAYSGPMSSIQESVSCKNSCFRKTS